MPKPAKGNGSINGNKHNNFLTGTSGSDLIDGKEGADSLFGLAGDDTLLGGDGNDLLDGGAGNDSVNGGAGTDTAVLAGARDLYTVTDLGGGLLRIAGPEGTDLFRDVELFRFADMTQSAAEVVVPRLANLAAGALEIDDLSLAPGEGSAVRFEVASTGIIDAGGTSFELLLATGPDAGSVVSVLDTQSAAPLATGTSASYSATIPADALAPGIYWVAVRVDAGDALAEENESDNLTDWMRITVEAPVTDLRLVSVDVNAASDTDLGYGGGQIVLDYTLKNAGNTGTGQYRLVSVLSRDGTISPDDLELAALTGELTTGGQVSGQLTGSIDPAVEAGDWQVLTMLEWAGGETEATPGDNITTNAVTLTPAIADLRLDAATLGPNTDTDLSGGGRLEMTYDWANAGAATPSYFRIRSYLSTDETVSSDDRSILGITGGTVTGQTSSVTTSHWFQPDFTPGDYFIISEISWGDGTPDATPENNWIVQQVSFTPAPYDLAITDVSLDPASDLVLDADGGWLGYSVDVANLGELAGSAPVTVYLSTDRNITADDIRIHGSTGTLAAGDSTTVFGGLEFDSSMVAAGDYTLIVTLAAPDDVAANSTFYLDLTLENPQAPPAITGTGDSDLLFGTAGDDLIEALGGDDVILASTGFDTVDGGAGLDVADFSQMGAGVRLVSDSFAEPGALFIENPTHGGKKQTWRNIEAVVGSGFDDQFYFRDTQVTQSDLGAGADMAVGSDADDVIHAGAGDDLVQGGLGDDWVMLGEGADLFGVVRFSEGPFPSGHGNDTITDFDVAEDILYFQIENGTDYDPLADTRQTAEGARIDYVDGSSIVLSGVDMADLTAANFMFEDTIYTYMA